MAIFLTYKHKIVKKRSFKIGITKFFCNFAYPNRQEKVFLKCYLYERFKKRPLVKNLSKEKRVHKNHFNPK